MIALYGICIWMLAALLVALTLVPVSGFFGIIIVCMCVVAPSLISTWRHHWRALTTTEHDANWTGSKL